ncbi:MAG: hypothetical protein ABS910_14825 [Arthrobacter sp.]
MPNPAEDHGPAPVQPGLPLPPGASAQVSAAAPRRSAGTRLRQVAASSMLAAVSVTGVAAAAPASQSQDAAWFLPAEAGDARSALPDSAVVARDSSERLAGVRRDLANAVAWGSVTAAQAEHFYSQISARIARGL